MKSKRLRRLTAFLLTLNILSTITPTALANPDDDEIIANFPQKVTTGWTKTDKLSSVITMSRADAYTYFTGEANRIYAELDTQLSSTSTSNATQLFKLYGDYLVYMNWMATNISQESDDAEGGDKWTILYDPGDYDEYLANSLIDNIESIRQRLSALDLLPKDNGLDYSSVLTDELLSSANYENFLGCLDYRNALEHLVNDYIDATIVQAVASTFNISGTDKDSLVSSLNGEFKASWYNDVTSTTSTTLPDEFITFVNSVKESVQPYLSVYNEVMSTYNTLSSRVLTTEVIVSSDGEHTVDGYCYVQTPLDNDVSLITKTLYLYLYSAENIGNDIDSIDTVDMSNVSNVLDLMTTNAKLKGSEVVVESNTADLTTLGYYILSAGVVYDPFVSKAGNDMYLETLKGFVNNSEQEDKLNSIVENALSIRKPIFVTSQSRTAYDDSSKLSLSLTADYKLAMLADMFNIDESSMNVFTVPKGTMVASSNDSSTYAYVTGSGEFDSTSNEAFEKYRSNFDPDYTGKSFTTQSKNMSTPVAVTTGVGGALMEFADGTVNKTGLLTSIILNNCKQDATGSNVIKQASTTPIFLNGLGDIVTADGTIVLPAVDNPIIYLKGNQAISTSEKGGTFADLLAGIGSSIGSMGSGVVNWFVPGVNGGAGTNSEGDHWWNTFTSVDQSAYYPYNAAFCNHYPAITVNNQQARFDSTRDNDIGKYVIGAQTSAVSSEGLLSYVWQGYKIRDKDSKSEKISNWNSSISRVLPLNVASLVVSSDSKSGYSLFGLYTGRTKWDLLHWNGKQVDFLVLQSMALTSDLTLFPLTADSTISQDSYLERSRSLVTSAVRYLSTVSGDSESTRSTAGTANIDYYIRTLLAQGLMGSVYSNRIVSQYKADYEEIVKDTYGRFTTLIVGMLGDLISGLGSIDGVLALKNGYENSIFSYFIGLVQVGYIPLLFVMLLLLAVRLMRGRTNMLYISFVLCCAVAGYQVYTLWGPSALPDVYNMIANDVNEDLVWKTIMRKAEDYSNTYKTDSRKDVISGKPKVYTATITLYKMTQKEMYTLANQLDVDVRTLKTGGSTYLDESAGIFVQGDTIKQSVDKLFQNNSMRGLYRTQWNQLLTGSTIESTTDNATVDTLVDNPYIIQLVSPYVSLESYYTPFCHIERSFVSQLNLFTNVFKLTRQTLSYGDGLYKDGFVFNSFTNSGLFTAPGDDEVLSENISDETVNGSLLITSDNIISLCHTLFDPQEDWLGIRKILANPSTSVKESLWGQMLLRNGYYKEDWTIGADENLKLSNLIDYVNNHTKKFVIQNSTQLASLSDENAIKIVSLYATTCFTQRVSEFGYWLYPSYINASDIQLKDLLFSISLDDLAQATTSTEDTMYSIISNSGLFTGIILGIVVFLSTLYVIVLNLMIPVLYILFGLLLIFKVFNTEKRAGLVRGYCSFTVITMLSYLLFCLSFRLIAFGGYRWYGYIACLLTVVLACRIIVFTLLSVLSNWQELGNGQFKTNILRATHLDASRNRYSTMSALGTMMGMVGISTLVSPYLRNSAGNFFSRFAYERRRHSTWSNPYGGYGGYGGYDNPSNPYGFTGLGNFSRTGHRHHNSHAGRYNRNSWAYRHMDSFIRNATRTVVHFGRNRFHF